MSAHKNASVARELSDAFERGDMERFDTLIADDVVWHEIGRSEPQRGKAQLQAMSSAGADVRITGRLHDVVASRDHAIALVEATAIRGARTLTYRTAEIYHIRHGKVVERWAFSDDTAVITEFFA